MQSGGPLLIASNHPNSFLDAIIFAILFKQPVYSLARGDAFANRFLAKLLRSLNMLPVYRISEGAENLEHNYSTFSACIEIFKNNGIVLIFSEGLCKNEWHLRPLKKGTARLAITAWQQGIPLQVLPAGINYSSFRIFGKNVILNFGNTITKESFTKAIPAGHAISAFNAELYQQLNNQVIELKPGDKEKIRQIFRVSQPLAKKVLLFIPAVMGYVIHAPIYYTALLLIKKRANDHFDSVMVGLLFLFYPVYLFAITVVTVVITRNVIWWLLILILPFTAWSALQVKRQTV